MLLLINYNNKHYFKYIKLKIGVTYKSQVKHCHIKKITMAQYFGFLIISHKLIKTF